MATPVTMPQLGETVVEGTITKWLKQEGETIERDEPLFEISTDKVDTEVPSPVGGKIVEIKVAEGETVSVGTELALIEAGGDGQAAQESPQAEAAEQPAAEEPRGDGQAAGDGEVQREPAGVPSAQPQQMPVAQQEQMQSQAPGREPMMAEAAPQGGPRSNILSPLVRRLAEENQVDLSQVQGTGTGGRITKKDVMTFIESGGARPAAAPTAVQAAPAPQAEAAPVAAPAPQPEAAPVAAPPLQPVPAPERPSAPAPAAAAAATTDREEVVPLTRMRQAIARNMVASMQTTARAWNLVEVDMENIVRTRAAGKDAFKQREGISLTYMPFVAKAVCEALLAFPDVNAELREDQLVRKHYVNLGIAVALEDGLIVPVVKGADGMNMAGLARAINDVATRARNRKLNPDDVHGGTFTITNPGPFGSIISVPIINPPQCAILAFDAVEKRPVVVNDAIAIRHMVYFSMSWDHRIIDGATAAQFLGRLKSNLETWDFGPELGLAPREA
ncbi:MAG TPA: dihydrolipoamide acetyltransferase family protein [Actinomycetota bacterium]|nr:dihydrolipoamide acetyltransferase family protein [Actinomycetota bacterium]